MTTAFENREQGYENKYAHDAEVEFKITARAHYMLGLWAAGKIQMNDKNAEAYAQSIVEAFVTPETKHKIKEKLQEDCRTAGAEITSEEVESEYQKFLQLSRNQAKPQC